MPFDFSKDKPLTRGDFESLRIVSLWEMLCLEADAFVRVCARLASASGMFFLGKKVPNAIDEADSKHLIKSLGLIELCENLQELDLPFSKMTADQLLDLLNKTPVISLNVIEEFLRDLLKRFQDELSGRYLLVIPAHRVFVYDLPGTILGEDVVSISEYSQLREDAAEAGDCFALGKYTACVFHLMRVMERCVQKMGIELGLSETVVCELEWQKILNNIRGAIKRKWPSEKDPERVKHESIISHLETVKIAWRNPTMHPKQTYTEEQAREVLLAVKTFVRNFVQLQGGLE
jgi:hypothetical protein